MVDNTAKADAARVWARWPGRTTQTRSRAIHDSGPSVKATSCVLRRQTPVGSKCLHFYFYFIDRDLGMIHVRLQSWFPMQIRRFPALVAGVLRCLAYESLEQLSTSANPTFPESIPHAPRDLAL